MGATGKQKTWVVWRFGTPDDKDYKRKKLGFLLKVTRISSDALTPQELRFLFRSSLP